MPGGFGRDAFLVNGVVCAVTCSAGHRAAKNNR